MYGFDSSKGIEESVSENMGRSPKCKRVSAFEFEQRGVGSSSHVIFHKSFFQISVVRVRFQRGSVGLSDFGWFFLVYVDFVCLRTSGARWKSRGLKFSSFQVPHPFPISC